MPVSDTWKQSCASLPIPASLATWIEHPAAQGELDGVAHQVDEHLPQPARIAAQLPRHVLQDVAGEVETLGLRLLGQQFDRAFDGRLQIEVEFLEVQLAGLDLGEVEDVVDDGQQRVAAAADRLDVLALLLVERACRAAGSSCR